MHVDRVYKRDKTKRRNRLSQKAQPEAAVPIPTSSMSLSPTQHENAGNRHDKKHLLPVVLLLILLA